MNERLIDTFFAMVRIPSESGNEQEFIAYVRGLLSREFGAECRIDDYGNLIASIAGKGCTKDEPLFFSAHADTVKPGVGIVPILVNGVIKPESDTILGSDDKAGIAQLVEAMRTAKRHPPIEFVITRQEELGFLGARQVDASRLKSQFGFVLDGGQLVDSVITGNPTHMYIDVEVVGRASHAGVAPEKGISAIEVAAHALGVLKLGRIDEETTLNFGIIQGGEMRNGIPEKVKLMGEARSLKHEKCISVVETVTQAFAVAAAAMGAKAVVHKEISYKAADVPEDAEPVRLAFEAIRRSSMTPTCRKAVAGTEASIFNEKGIAVAVLSQGVCNVHSKSEHVSVADMEKAVEILVNILEIASEE